MAKYTVERWVIKEGQHEHKHKHETLTATLEHIAETNHKDYRQRLQKVTERIATIMSVLHARNVRVPTVCQECAGTFKTTHFL